MRRSQIVFVSEKIKHEHVGDALVVDQSDAATTPETTTTATTTSRRRGRVGDQCVKVMGDEACGRHMECNPTAYVLWNMSVCVCRKGYVVDEHRNCGRRLYFIYIPSFDFCFTYIYKMKMSFFYFKLV